MPAGTFRGQHGHNPRDGAREAGDYVYCDDAQEQWRGRWDWGTEEDKILISHGSLDLTRMPITRYLCFGRDSRDNSPSSRAAHYCRGAAGGGDDHGGLREVIRRAGGPRGAGRGAHDRDRLAIPDVVALRARDPVDGVLQNAGHRVVVSIAWSRSSRRDSSAAS